VVGVLVLAVLPGVEAGSLLKTVANGALLGFVAHGTYDITNLSTIRDWPVIVSVVDIVWGSVPTGTVAGAGCAIARWHG